MTRKFRVGDRVRFVTKPVAYSLDYIGTQATITKIFPTTYELDFPSRVIEGTKYCATDSELELVTPKPEVWIVSTLGGQVIDKHFLNEADAREAANRFTQSCPKHKFYISKAVGYVESVPIPSVTYVKLD